MTNEWLVVRVGDETIACLGTSWRRTYAGGRCLSTTSTAGQGAVHSKRHLKRTTSKVQRVQILASVFPSTVGYAYYSEVEATKFVNLAAAAYADSANVTARQSCIDLSYPDNGFHVLMVMSTPCDKHRNQCQAYIAVSDEVESVIISFRGTNSGNQLLSEFSNGLEDYTIYIEQDQNGNNVTIGHANVYFLIAVNRMWSDMVEPSIRGRENYTFLMTGHSLGGALASLTAFRIAFRGYSSKKRAESQKFVPYAFRVVHYTDPVPHLPPLNVNNASADGQPYHHPREIWYNDAFSSYVLCSETDGEDWSCSDKERFWEYGHKGTYRHTHYFHHLLSEYGAMGCNGAFNLTPFCQIFLLILLLETFLFKLLTA